MTGTPATSGRLYARLLAAAVLAAAITSGALLGGSLRGSQPYLATGTVRCASHTTPVGVWVSALYGDAGWATTRREPDQTVLRYSRPITHGSAYQLHVGCGGTPRNWGMTATSDSFRADAVDLICNDQSSRLGRLGRWLAPMRFTGRGRALFGECRPI